MKSSILSHELHLSNPIPTRHKKSKIVEYVCFLFILLFVYAALSKVLDYHKFTVQLSKSPLLTRFSGTIAWTIPSIEIVISLMLAIPRFRLSGLYAGFSLMLMFTFYIIYITKLYDGEVPCSCGGILQSMNWNQHLAFNILFSIFGLFGILFYQPTSYKKSGPIIPQ